MTAIKTIVFDLSEVLIYGLIQLEDGFAERIGLPESFFFTAFGGPELQAFFRGKIIEDEYLAGVIQRNQMTISLADLKTAIRSNFRHRYPGMQAVLEGLKPNYALVLLSDHGREWVDHILDIHPFLEIFDQLIFSYDLDGTKKEAETFSKLLNHLKQPAEACLFIDDQERNCAAAISKGIDAIQFTSTEDLIQSLSQRGIEISG